MSESEQKPVAFPQYSRPQGIPIDENNLKRPLTKLISRMMAPKKISRSTVHVSHKKGKKKPNFY